MTGVHIHCKDPIARIAYLSSWCLLCSLGLLSLFLSWTTGRPIPREFVPEDQLELRVKWKGGIPDDQGRPIFFALSSNERCLVATSAFPGESVKSETGSQGKTMTVMDTDTLEVLGSLKYTPSVGASFILNSFEISPDRKLLITTKLDRLQIYGLESGKEETVAIQMLSVDLSEKGLTSSKLEFSLEDRYLLVYSTSMAVLYDLFGRKMLGAFGAKPNCRILAGFFDSQDCARILVCGDNLEVWDLVRNRIDRSIDQPDLDKRSILQGVCRAVSRGAFGMPILATIGGESNLLLIRSLEDGRLLRSFDIPTGTLGPIRFSPDGQFLVCDYWHRNPLLRLLRGFHKGIDQWLDTRFPLELRQTLIEVSTGKTWIDILGNIGCAFTDDSLRLISFSEEGRLIYDLPPSCEKFTSWAWVTLAAWVGLAAILWKVRMRR